MITGAHVLLYSTDPETDRRFVRDVLEFPSIDVGGGWLIFKLPPSEMAIHPTDGEFEHRHAGHALIGAVLYLMCDDVRAEVNRLATRNVTCTPIAQERWGIKTTIPLPSGGEIGLYQPTHPTALDIA